MTNVLVAGATGYLGTHIIKELENWRIPATAIARNPGKLAGVDKSVITIKKAEVTKPESLAGICEGISTVISTVGITRQKEGLTYMDVDFQANMNLLEEAKKAGVKKFIYISAIDGDKLRHLQIMAAKERFVDALKSSGIEYCIIRPNGFFSDMRDFLAMAKSGRVYLFGDGEFKLNPIHGADLAEVIVRAIAQTEKEIPVGGPDILTQNEIAEMALNAWSNPVKITLLPDWIRRATIKGAKLIGKQAMYGPLEFFLTLMARDNIAPRYGSHRLQDFFKQEVKQQLKL